MTLHIYRSDKNAPKRPLRRWDLLIMDALFFYEHTPGGATAQMVAQYISPRLGWWERWWVVGTVYAKLYAMVDRGWVEDYQVEPIPSSRQRYRYRVNKPVMPTWRDTGNESKDVH